MHTQQGSDPLWELGLAAQKGPKANVDFRISHWGDSVSVSCTVALECAQTEAHLQAAAQHAFTQATRFVNDAVSRFDQSMPMLPTGG